MFCAPRQAVALLALLLLPVFSALGPSAQAGLVHLDQPVLEINPDGHDCQLVFTTDPLGMGPEVWTCPADEPTPLDIPALVRQPVPTEGAGTSSASTSSAPSTGPAVILAVHREPPAPALAAYLVARHKSFIPDPALSSLFRPPRSARLG